MRVWVDFAVNNTPRTLETGLCCGVSVTFLCIDSTITFTKCGNFCTQL